MIKLSFWEKALLWLLIVIIVTFIVGIIGINYNELYSYIKEIG
jgi:cell division protein FtsL